MYANSGHGPPGKVYSPGGFSNGFSPSSSAGSWVAGQATLQQARALNASATADSQPSPYSPLGRQRPQSASQANRDTLAFGKPSPVIPFPTRKGTRPQSAGLTRSGSGPGAVRPAGQVRARPATAGASRRGPDERGESGHGGAGATAHTHHIHIAQPSTLHVPQPLDDDEGFLSDEDVMRDRDSRFSREGQNIIAQIEASARSWEQVEEIVGVPRQLVLELVEQVSLSFSA